MVLSRLDGGERRSDNDKRLWGRLRDRPSLRNIDGSPEGLLDLEQPSALFDPDLCGAHGDALSPEELGSHSASGPIIHIGTAGPIDDWGGATPKRSIIWSFMEESRASFMSFIQSWTFGNVGDGTGRTWEGVATTWDDGGTVARVVTADTGRALVTSTAAGCGADDDEAIDRRPVRRRKEVLIGLHRRRGNLLNPVQGRRACQDSWQSRQVTGLVLRHGTRRIRRGGWRRQVKNGDWNNCWRLGSVYCEGQSFARLLFIVLWGHLTLLVSSKLFHAVKQWKSSGKHRAYALHMNKEIHENSINSQETLKPDLNPPKLSQKK